MQPWQLTPLEFLHRECYRPVRKPRLSLYDWLLCADQPWPNTAVEVHRAQQAYAAALAAGQIEVIEVGVRMRPAERHADRVWMLQEHRRQVRQALDRGLPVPARVRQGYDFTCYPVSCAQDGPPRAA